MNLIVIYTTLATKYFRYMHHRLGNQVQSLKKKKNIFLLLGMAALKTGLYSFVLKNKVHKHYESAGLCII